MVISTTWWGNCFTSSRSFGLDLALIFPKAIIVRVNLVVFALHCGLWGVFSYRILLWMWVFVWGVLQRWSETQRALLATGRTSPSVVHTVKSNPLIISGVCECSDFTAGMTCEHCLDGYYGNALIGTPGDCQPCPCPDRTSCAQIAETRQVVCTNCPAGQTGEIPLWHHNMITVFTLRTTFSFILLFFIPRCHLLFRYIWS